MALGNRASVNCLRKLQTIAEDEEVRLGKMPPAIPPKSRRRSSLIDPEQPPPLDPFLLAKSRTPSPLQQGHLSPHPPPPVPSLRRGPSRYRTTSYSPSPNSSAGSSPPQLGSDGDGFGRHPSLPLATYMPYDKGSATSILPKGGGAMNEKRGNEWFARRGGWVRLGGLVCLFVILLVGLAVGLSFGITKKNKGSDASTSPSSSSPGTFPAGSFAFTAALIERATGCAENADTWRCYPYQTYSDSAVDSGATFFWILSPTTSSSEEEGQDDAAAGYQISSSENPFSPRFDNVSMKVLDRHQYTERFSFEFSMNKTGSSASPLPVNLDAGGAAGDSDSTETPGEVDGGAQSANTASKRQEEEAETKPATCTFGDTVFQATIWTRQPPNVTTGLGGSTPDFDRKFGSWPGRVQIMQRTGGGPSCKDLAGGAIEARKGEGECLCRYANFGME